MDKKQQSCNLGGGGSRSALFGLLLGQNPLVINNLPAFLFFSKPNIWVCFPVSHYTVSAIFRSALSAKPLKNWNSSTEKKMIFKRLVFKNCKSLQANLIFEWKRPKTLAGTWQTRARYALVLEYGKKNSIAHFDSICSPCILLVHFWDFKMSGWLVSCVDITTRE